MEGNALQIVENPLAGEVGDLRFEIARGLARLVLLPLENRPAGKKIKELARVWLDCVFNEFGWPENTVEPRVREAFAEMERTRTCFPPPQSLITILKRMLAPEPYIPTHEENMERREADKREAEERQRSRADFMAAKYAPQLESPEVLAARREIGRKKLRELREITQIGHAAKVVRNAKARLAGEVGGR